MKAEPLVRAMRTHDLAAVLEIQAGCYDPMIRESGTAFLSKLAASPGSCFVALLADAPAGYLIALPATVECPPMLNTQTCTLPPAPDCLYLHDLAVHPGARGAGVADALLAAYFEGLRRLRFRIGCLTAVNDSGAYWARHGFRAAGQAGAAANRIATYGYGAQYMRFDLPV